MTDHASGDAPVVHARESVQQSQDTRPTVTSSGQVFWSVRDLLFSPNTQRAAEAIKQVNSKTAAK